ncbi:MAG TPA: hypothetical protein VJO53_10795, partial [Candidatus Acidoferrales bacterium]|nr:hypothetical protein [Candidatus Acidoferrales bacterium]
MASPLPAATPWRSSLIAITLIFISGAILPAQGQQQPAKEQTTSAAATTSAGPQQMTQEQRADLIRRRAQWFFEQRANPLGYIPAGALQKAIEQRDRMKAQQHSGPGVVNAAGIITFPGDALWHLMGPQPVNEVFSVNGGFPTASGRVTAIAVDPTDATGKTVYIGAAAGGVWKTTDGGATWTPLTDSQPSLAVGSITIDPNNHNTIYVGTGEENFSGDAFYGAGILKSSDGGTTWTQLGATTFAHVFGPNSGGAYIGAIAVQPGNSSIVLAAVTFIVGGTVGGIYRSADAGVTWAEVSAGTPPIGIAATGVVFEPTVVAGTTAIAYAAMGWAGGDAANGIYKSTDSGVTWTKQSGGLPTTKVGRITLGYAPSTSTVTSNATIYAAIADSSVGSNDLLGLFKTTNGGTSWTQLVATPAFCNHQCWYDLAVGVHPANSNFVVVGGGAFTNNSSSLFKTTDGGTTWTGSTVGTDFTRGSTSTRPHVDTHAVVFAANGATPRLYIGDDGGVWRTDDPTVTPPLWVDDNTQLAITQFYPGPSAGIADENYGFGGTQDNDTEVFSGTLDWTNVFACGDGGFTAIDPMIPTTVYTGCDSVANALVQKSVFNGAVLPGPTLTFNPADSGINHGDRMQFIPPLTIDESNPTTLYFGTSFVYQSIDGANSWNPISPDLTNGTSGRITTIDVAHSSSSNVFVGTTDAKVWETTTGGAAWNEVDNVVPGQLPTTREVTAVRSKRGDTTGNIVYVTFSGFGSCGGCDGKGHIFKTTNAGTAWKDISGDLPDIPVNDLIVDHQGTPLHDALYIATDVGVFSCPDPEAATPCTNWTVVGDGLPNSPILGLAMRRSSRILRAATHGRSMWEIQLTDVSPLPVASLSSLTPAAAMVNDPTTPVTVTGLNFSSNTVVLFDGVSVGTPTFVNTTQLTISVNSSLLTDGRVFSVTLTDPAGTDRSSLPFTVMNPIASPSTMSPSNASTYTAVPLHFTGSGFVPSSIVNFSDTSDNPLFSLSGGTPSSNGTVFDLTTTSVQFTTPATYHVTVSNPLPGGGTNGTIFVFTIIQNPGALAIFNPSIIILGPQAIGGTTPVLNVTITNPGASALHITAQTITGTNATNFSFAAPTSGTTCNFPSSGTSGTGAVTVAANGGSCTFGMTFSPDAPPGQVTRMASLTVTDDGVGHPQVVQIIGLLPFVAGPLAIMTPVDFGPVALGTTSVTMNSTLLNAGTAALHVSATGFTISGTDLGDFHIVAAAASANPACSAPPFTLNASSACDVGVSFTPTSPARIEHALINVADDAPGSPQSAPLTGSGVQITSISPSVVATGGPAFTLTVNGGGFASSAVVNVNGSARLTTFVSATQLLASITAADIASAGSLAISVTTPVPGGTPSEPKTLVVAQAPDATNDNIAFATDASAVPFRSTQDTTHATVDTASFPDPTPACGGGSKARSVWFKYVATANGKVSADTRFSTYNAILSVWTTNPPSFNSFTAVGCNNAAVPSTPAAALLGFNVTSGTTYYVMVTDVSATGAGGTLTFSLDFASAPPANDNFVNAIDGSVTPFSNTVNTIEATTEVNDPTPSCASGPGLAASGRDNTVWYKFTAPSAGTVTADTLTSPYETILSAWTGTSGSLVAVAGGCNVSAGSGVAQSQVSFPVTSGTQYFFMVSAFLGDGGTTNFHITLNTTAGPAATLAVTGFPNPATAGAAANFTVTAKDALNNTATGYTGTVHFTSSDGTAVLPANYTFVAGDAGV